MSYQLDEPCKYTCPDIDAIIDRINGAIMILERIDPENPTANDSIESALSELNGLDYELESLRKSNSELRNWGKDLAWVVEKIRDVI